MNVRLLILIAVFLYLSTLSFSEISYISGCTVINSPGTYLLTSDINGDDYKEQIEATYACILINSSDVFLDCQGHTIKRSSSYIRGIGIFTKYTTNVVIANCKVEHYDNCGFDIYSSTNSTLINNIAHNNIFGFCIRSSTNSILINNIADNNGDGVYNGEGFDISFSTNSTLINNTAINNSIGGFSISFSTNSTLINNTAINNSRGGFYISYSTTNSVLINNTAINSGCGFYIPSLDDFGFPIPPSTNFTIINNTAINNRHGFCISSFNFTLINNTAINNSWDGFYIDYSVNFTLINNTANSNSRNGFSILFSTDFTLLDNAMCYNNRSDINLTNASLQRESNNMCDKVEDDQHIFQCTYKCPEQKKNQGELPAGEKQPEKPEEKPEKPPQTRTDCPYGTVEKQGVVLCKPIGIPNDTSCKNGWPAHEGSKIFLNEENFACDLFEVTRPDIMNLTEEALNCCLNDCSGKCHSLCNVAYRYSGFDKTISDDTLKKCVALYEIYGNGPAARYMQEYYYNELNCFGYFERGSYQTSCFDNVHNITKSLSCRRPTASYPKSWVSDNEVEKNLCYFSDLPAHVNLNILSTGTCVDYSVATTTLLRLSGFKKEDVYTVASITANGGHAYNLVRFPGDGKYTIIDTVGNNPMVYSPGNLPGSWWPYCEFGANNCYNDAGQSLCPQKADIYGCTGCEETDFLYYRCNGSTVQQLHQNANCEYEWKDIKKCDYGCAAGVCKKPPCSSQYLDEFRCSGDYVERKYRYQDCSVAWRTVDYCEYGCSNGECLKPSCKPGPVGEPRCVYLGTMVAVDYQESDCTIKTRYLESCPYGCENGKCKKPSKQSSENRELLPTCEPQNVFKCEGSKVVQEITREDCTHEKKEVEYCQYGCSNGVCKSPPEKRCTPGFTYSGKSICKGNDVLSEYITENCTLTYVYSHSCPLGCDNGECLDYYSNTTVDIEVEKTAPQLITLGDVMEVNITVKNKAKLPVVVSVREKIGEADAIEPELVYPAADADLIAARSPYFYWYLTLDPLSQQTVSYKIRPLKVGDYIFSPTVVTFDQMDKKFYSNTLVTNVLRKENNICEPEKGENSITAPDECPSGSKDNLCDLKSDGKCDPDCKTGDPDCNSPLNPKNNLCCPLPLIFAVLILLYLSITNQTSSYRF